MARGKESGYGIGFPAGSEESREEEQRVSGKDPLRKKKEAISKNPDPLERLIQKDEKAARIEAGEEEEDTVSELDSVSPENWQRLDSELTDEEKEPLLEDDGHITLLPEEEKQEERSDLPKFGQARHGQSKKQQGISAAKKEEGGFGHKSWRNLGRKPRSKDKT